MLLVPLLGNNFGRVRVGKLRYCENILGLRDSLKAPPPGGPRGGVLLREFHTPPPAGLLGLFAWISVSDGDLGLDGMSVSAKLKLTQDWLRKVRGCFPQCSLARF